MCLPFAKYSPSSVQKAGLPAGTFWGKFPVIIED